MKNRKNIRIFLMLILMFIGSTHAQVVVRDSVEIESLNIVSYKSMKSMQSTSVSRQFGIYECIVSDYTITNSDGITFGPEHIWGWAYIITDDNEITTAQLEIIECDNYTPNICWCVSAEDNPERCAQGLAWGALKYCNLSGFDIQFFNWNRNYIFPPNTLLSFHTWYYVYNPAEPSCYMRYDTPSITQQSSNVYHITYPYVKFAVILHPGNYRISTENDSLNHNENTTLHVQALGTNGEAITIPDETQLDFTLDENGGLYGTYVGPDGIEAKELNYITYGDAHNGKIKYIANGEESPDTLTCGFIVKESDNESKAGYGIVTLLGDKEETYYYTISTNPIAISYGDTSSLCIRAKNQDHTDKNMPELSTLNISIVGGDSPDGSYNVGPEGCGYFLSPFGINNNDLTDIFYQDANNGFIKFIANGEKQERPLLVRISASDGTASGDGILFLRGEIPYFEINTDPDTIQHKMRSTIYITVKDEEGNDLEVPDDFPITLKIYEDLETTETYGNLIGPDGTHSDLLEYVPLSYFKEGNIEYVADFDTSISSKEIIILVEYSESPYVMGLGKIFVREDDEFANFAVTLNPDTILHTKTANVFVQSKDACGNDIDPPENTLLNFSLDAKGQLYGNLIGPGGAIGKVLNNVTYAAANQGLVKYIADEEQPDSLDVVTVHVKNIENTVSGNGQLVVRASFFLTIDIPAPKMVWPDLPSGSGGNPGNRHKKQNILVSLMKDSDPVSDHNVAISVRMILPSGGHYKSTQPPNNRFGQLRASTGEIGIPTITAPTRADGTIDIEYTAMQFGGSVEFTAETTINGMTLEAKDTLIVRVPDLELLEDKAYYTKVGGKCCHHGPSDMGIPASCQTPDDNHYATATVTRNLTFIALYWHLLFPTEHDLYINDMSLPCGGLFDYNGDWQPPHGWHRVGESADIRTEFPWEREGVPIRSPRKSLEILHIVGNNEFEDICRARGARPRIHGVKGTIDEHYHLEF